MQTTVQQVQINDEWLNDSYKNNHFIDLNNCTCIVCYGIVIGQPMECNKCQKILCQQDFNKIASNKNKCPNCQVFPFMKSEKTNRLVIELLDKLKFQCQICPKPSQKPSPKSTPQYQDSMYESEKSETERQPDPTDSEDQLVYASKRPRPTKIQTPKITKMPKTNKISFHQEQLPLKTYSRDELCSHLFLDHNVCVSGYSIGYEFEAVFNNGQEIITLNKYQNLDLNQLQESQKNKDTKRLTYPLSYNIDLLINFEKGEVEKREKNGKEGKPQIWGPAVKGQLIKNPSIKIRKNVDYEVWSVNIFDVDHYYTEEQHQMIQKEYKDFLSNKNLNEMMFDHEGKRYRISFSEMKQINTSTKYERKVKRKIIRLT